MIYNTHQAVPNMAQAIDPLAAPGSSFQFLDTGMVVTDTYNPQVAPVEWMAGQAVSTAVNPNRNSSGSVNKRVQPRLSRSISVL